jgi:uroporphyrin-III C-methyltransferase
MGKVYLVGAGPGDPELLTVRAVRLLESADVVLHDGLVSPPIIDLVNDKAIRLDIGKRCGHKLLSQDEINALLVDYSRSFTNVVRLKGGDPSVFGRSGEEIEALTNAGIDFEIVPGITTALAAAASAEISLTDRRLASSVTLLTAHRGTGRGAVEWNRLVTSGATIAIYMPGHNYRELSSNLKSAGLAPNTPCVVVSRATLPDERTVLSTVAQLASLEPLQSPAHIIVGRCVNPAHVLVTEMQDQRSANPLEASLQNEMENIA